MSGIKAIVAGQEKTITRVPMLVNGVDKGWEVRTGDGELLWGAKRTITGTTPMTLKGYGIPLDACDIIGNDQQTGTPSPDNIIMPTFCGVRTGNLFDGIIGTDNVLLDFSGKPLTNNAYALSEYIPIEPNTPYVYHFYHNIAENRSAYSISEYDINKKVILPLTLQQITEKRDYAISFTTKANTAYIRINWKKAPDENLMLNLGSTALPYEPFGWKIPISCGGENLLDPSTATLGKYINAQGVETNSTAPTPKEALNHTSYIEIQPNTKYTYHYKYTEGIANTIALCWFDASKNLISRDTKNVNYQNIDYTLTATSPANAAFCIINFTGYLPNGSMQLSFNSGSTPKPYAPYSRQTVPVYLGQTQTVRRIKKLVLTGEENWALWSSGMPDVERYYYKWGKSTPSDYGLICTHLPFRNKDGNFEHIRLGGSSRDDFVIYISKTSAPTAADFKAYLAAQYAAGTPVTAWYVLATEQTGIVNEPLAKIGDYADELHSTDAAVTIPTIKGQNTLTVDTELQPSQISVTGHIKSIS